MSRKSRTRAKRRDRRKAKQSEYRREGKANMGSRVGHGTSGSPGHARRILGRMVKPARINKPIKFSNPSIATIGEILAAKAIKLPALPIMELTLKQKILIKLQKIWHWLVA